MIPLFRIFLSICALGWILISAEPAAAAAGSCPLGISPDCEALVKELSNQLAAETSEAKEAIPHTVVFQFYADWCRSCDGLTRVLVEDVGVPARTPGVGLVLVNIDAQLKIGEHQRFLAVPGVTSLHDKNGRIFRRLFPDGSVPEVLVVRDQTQIVGAFAGHFSNADVASLKRLLK